MKYCKHCDKEFDINDDCHWYKCPDKRRNLGYFLLCRINLYKHKKRSSIIHNKLEGTIEYKFCNYCNKWIDINNKEHWRSEKNSTCKSGYCLRCRVSRIKTKKEWNANNKDHCNSYNRQRNNRIRKTPRGQLDHNLGSAILKSLQEEKAGRTWEILVGYTLDDLYNHLETLFIDNMSWDNYGRKEGNKCWEVDHIVPKSWFKYETAEDPEFKLCWSLDNLQPKWADENRSKNNRFIG